jgi:hypothetical protein
MVFPKMLGCTALILIAGATAGAHHSFSALFDAGRTITFEGEVTQFEFKAPHSYVKMSVPADGETQAWEVETATPGMLIRHGITPETLRAGQTITVIGNPTRDGRKLIRLLTIIMPDGREVQLQ